MGSLCRQVNVFFQTIDWYSPASSFIEQVLWRHMASLVAIESILVPWIPVSLGGSPQRVGMPSIWTFTNLHFLYGKFEEFANNEKHTMTEVRSWHLQDIWFSHSNLENYCLIVRISEVQTEFLTHKQLETHACVLSTVVTVALVLKHQAICIHSVVWIFIVFE